MLFRSRGESRGFGFSAVEANYSGSFTWSIDWGDGRPTQIVTGGSSILVDKTYASAGAYTVTVTAANELGRTSAPIQRTVKITD